jgi:flagellar motor switch protein FliN/FliY
MATEPEAEDHRKPIHLGELQDFADIPYELTILIGKTMMKINDLLQLERGSVVELTKSAGESFDVLVNGRLVAHGDATVIDDRFAIRITDLVDPGRRER